MPPENICKHGLYAGVCGNCCSQVKRVARALEQDIVSFWAAFGNGDVPHVDQERIQTESEEAIDQLSDSAAREVAMLERMYKL